MYSSYPNTVILPMRAKVSADFGTAVNTDNFGAASAGVTYTGALRNFWLPDQGLLINVSADEGQFEDLILTAPALIVPGGGIYSWRPVRAQAAGTVAWVHTPFGHGLPTLGALHGQWRISIKAKQAIGSLIVTSQAVDY